MSTISYTKYEFSVHFSLSLNLNCFAVVLNFISSFFTKLKLREKSLSHNIKSNLLQALSGLFNVDFTFMLHVHFSECFGNYHSGTAYHLTLSKLAFLRGNFKWYYLVFVEGAIPVSGIFFQKE